eukprot:2890636-Rhodomonas_salina.6
MTQGELHPTLGPTPAAPGHEVTTKQHSFMHMQAAITVQYRQPTIPFLIVAVDVFPSITVCRAGGLRAVRVRNFEEMHVGPPVPRMHETAVHNRRRV